MMKRLFSFLCLFGLSSAALAKEHTLVRVTVLDEIPTANSYNWTTAGHGSVSCYSSGCSSYYRPSTSGTSTVQGAIVRLQMEDGRIVIAECARRSNVGLGIALALVGDAPEKAYDDCRRPPAGSIIEGEFHGSVVHLYFRAPSIDGTGRALSETYYLRGVLEPQGSPQASTSPVHASQLPSQPAAHLVQVTQTDSPVSKVTPASTSCLILTVPYGAGVELDGKDAGVSPVTLQIPFDEVDHKITIQMEGWMPVERKLKTCGIGKRLDLQLKPN